MDQDNTCFVISPIGDSDTDVRERSDKVFNYVIEPPVDEFGYSPVRADQISEPGIITSQIIEYVVEAPLVIADLTGSNANVFYELAVRHAYQKPLIQLIQEGENIPFDVAATRTIQLDIEDIESVEKAKTEIQEQIESIESEGRDFENPISVASNLRDLRESSDPEERSMADIMENLSELRGNIRAIQSKLDQPKEIIPPGYIRDLTHHFNREQSEEAMFILDEIEDLGHEMLDTMKEDNSIPDEEITPLHEEFVTRINAVKRRVVITPRRQESLSEF